MSLSHLVTDNAGPILFTMDSNTSSFPSASPSMSSSPSKVPHSPPPLPKRNARRASRFLDALLDSSAPTTATTHTTVTATTSVSAVKTLKSSPKMTSSAHEVYLSSEEDASSLGDVSDSEDAEEYDYDSDTVEYIAPVTVQMLSSAPAEEPARRHSHEDKARLVSVIYAGKPSIVDLAVERAARRCSVSARSNWSDSSASRPSTSAGSAPSTAVSSVNVSPQRHQHKRNSSGSMMASLRVRKAMEMETIADAPTLNNETDMPRLMRSYTTTASRTPSHNAAVIAATAAANAAATSRNTTAPPLSLSPRTPTFSHSNLLRGVTRSLTLNRRGSRMLNKERDAAFAMPQLSSISSSSSSSFLSSAAPPLPGQLPGVAPAPSDVNGLRRKSLALSVASLGLGGGDRNDNRAPPMPRTPEEHMFSTSISPALRRASMTSAFLSPAPAHRVLSKKNGNGNAPPSSSTSFFSRRRSVRLT